MKRYRKHRDPMWDSFLRIEHREKKREERNLRRLRRRRVARAFGDGSYQAAVTYWSRLRYRSARVLRQE